MDERLIGRIERAHSGAIWTDADSVVIDTPAWAQVTSPSSRLQHKNTVFRARLSAAEADARIAAVAEDHRRRGAALRWFVWPRCTPADLGRRLEQAGFTPGELSHAMVAAPGAIQVPLRPSVTVAPIGPADAQVYTRTLLAGWRIPADQHALITADVVDSVVHAGPGLTFYVGHVGGVPAGTACLRVVGDVGVLQGASVVPAHRGRGVFLAMVRARLGRLRTLGVTTAVVFADAETSGPICAALGFQTLCPIHTYRLG